MTPIKKRQWSEDMRFNNNKEIAGKNEGNSLVIDKYKMQAI